MSDEELFEQVQLLLQRQLTGEERQFLVLVNQVLRAEKKPVHKAKAAAAAVKIA